MSTPLRRAIKNAGGQVALAAALNIWQSAVSGWVRRNKLPAERVLDVERLGRVSRHELRPDIYPRPSSAVAVLNSKRHATKRMANAGDR